MKTERDLTLTLVLLGLTILISFFVSPFEAQAQGTGNPGNNAVFNPSSACCIGSTAFIDAFIVGGNHDICTAIYNILSGTSGSYSPGAVIDARGIVGSALVCPMNTSPWRKSGVYQNKPSTILLPPGTIQIPITWVLPNGTRLIGEGTTGAEDINGSAVPTTIQALSGFSGAMIQFGDSTNCPSSVCTGIAVEHLVLDGTNQAITGILNENAQDLSYANHVTLYRILGTGLSIAANPAGGSAQNSGPYENINYDTGPSGVFGSTCASINGLGSTHGIRGLSCVSTPDSQSAVLLDSSNNTLKDVRIVGFFDGILVGSKAVAHSNVLLNIFGDTGTIGLQPPVHVVHITASHLVTDLSIMGVNNPLGGPNNEYSVEDDLTSTTLIDPYVAMYVVGQSKNNGYSRYTTSSNAATWAFGNTTPAASSCPNGSLYSCTGGSNKCTAALWGCQGQAWSPIK